MYRDPRFYLGILIGVLLAAMWGSFAQTKFVLDKPSTGFHLHGRIEAGLGRCYGQQAPIGIWQERDVFPSNEKVSGPCAEIGLRLPLAKSWGVRLAFIDFGSQSDDAVAIPDEHQAAAFVAGAVACDPHNGFTCLGSWKGTGATQGVTVGAYRDFTVGRWTFSPEVGLLFYRYWWHEQVTPIQPGSLRLDIDESGNFTSTYVAATLRRGWFFLRGEIFNHVKGGIAQGRRIDAVIGTAVAF